MTEASFIFVYKRLSYATNDRNMLTSNKEKCPLIWRTININMRLGNRYNAADDDDDDNDKTSSIHTTVIKIMGQKNADI